MTRRDYKPGEGPVAGIVAAVLLSAAVVVVVVAVVTIIQGLGGGS